jgi:hypothetical protein
MWIAMCTPLVLLVAPVLMERVERRLTAEHAPPPRR